MEREQILVDKFVRLFRGRGDAYGSWDGGCIRQPLNKNTFESHLKDGPYIGVYPLVPFNNGWGCVWGCTDIDVDDLDAARNLQTAFTIKNITSWVEKTRKGYHVWVFTPEPVSASTMRRAFLAAHQAINYPAKEVNPKQESAGSGYGNYVRLPYYGQMWSIGENRYMLDENNNPMSFETFIDLASTSMATEEQLQGIASLWKQPEPPKFVSNPQEVVEVKSIMRDLGNAIPYVIWRDGPLETQDRSTALVRLSHQLCKSGVEPDKAFAVLKSADERWGKFHLRHDGDKELMRIVERTYNIVFVDLHG